MNKGYGHEVQRTNQLLMILSRLLLILVGSIAGLSAACLDVTSPNPRVGDDYFAAHPNLDLTIAKDGSSIWLLNLKNGSLSRSLDGGRTWTAISGEAVGGVFQAIDFINARTGLAVGKAAQLWTTNDGGDHWRQISSYSNEAAISVPQIKIIDEQTVWLRDTYSIWRTSDYGDSWTNVSKKGGARFHPPGLSLFPSPKTAIVAGSEGTIHITNDGGATWSTNDKFKNGDVRAMDTENEGSLWIAGFRTGTGFYEIVKSSDGGKEWHTVGAFPKQSEIYSIDFPGNEVGWASGRRQVISDRVSMLGLILRTTDGGKTWEEIESPPNEECFSQIYFSNRSEGWLVGRTTLYRTDDGGKTWSIAYRPDGN